MNFNYDPLVFWNPWWSGEKEWLDAYPRETLNEIQRLFERKEILTISGVRRSGKTTILYLIIQSLLDNGINPKNILHINLEDPAYKDNSIYSLYQKYLELVNPSGKIYLFLDEIQEVSDWQREIRKLYDGVPQLKIILTGSNSSLLKGEYARLLTGRTLFREIYPFSFKEFVNIKGLAGSFQKHILIRKRTQIMHHFREYIANGGYPEVVKEKDSKMKTLLLKDYYTSILTRDVLRRYPIRQVKKYEKASHYLISNIANSFSVKSLSSLLSINMHTLEEYIGFLEDVYLLFPVNHFSYSLKKQITYPRKIYCVDNGLINAVSFRFSEDIGKLLENLVFIEIKRRGYEYYYWKDIKECDFIIKDDISIKDAIQVTFSLSKPDTAKRELEGLISALKEFGLKRGIILTHNEFDTKKIDGKTIEVMPVWYWLLNG
ncbi:MAG: ATP-binding protein [Nitrospirota bacterium]